MISSTADFATVIASDDRKFLTRLSVNGTELDGAIARWSISKGSCGGNQFNVGAVMSSAMNLTIKGLTTNVKDQDIKVEIGLLVNGAYEYITLGYFTATEVKKTHYQTEITAYGHSVSKTKDILVMSNPQTLANIKNAISSATGVNVTYPGGVNGTRLVTKSLEGLTTYQVLQVLASVIGGYAVDRSDGSIAILRYDATSTLSVGADRMKNLPDVEEANFTITGVKCTAGEDTYTSGTVNLEVTNEYMTQDLFTNEFAPAVIGYSYRPASIDLSKGDPRLEGDDVLTVTDVNSATYIVPCHTVVHTYDGGLATSVNAIRATMISDKEGTVAPISTQLKQQEKTIAKVDRIASNTNQYFWFNGTGNDTGAHITEVPQDEWGDNTSPNYHSGGNLLARSNGIAVREGMTELATFGQTGAVIGRTDSGHTDIQASGMKVYGNDGTVELANIGYGSGTSSGGGTADAPYYTLGTRKSGTAKGNYSIAEGYNTEASGYCDHAEGEETKASGGSAHAEGYKTKALGGYSHAEGESTTADNDGAHAEGYNTKANGIYSHAEGDSTVADEYASHAEGYGTKAGSAYQHVQGMYNVVDTNDKYVDIVGYGTGDNYRANISALEATGTLRLAGTVRTGCNADSTGGIDIGFNGSVTPTKVTNSKWTSGDITVFRKGSVGYVKFNGATLSAISARETIATVPADYCPITETSGRLDGDNGGVNIFITGAGDIRVNPLGAGTYWGGIMFLCAY